MLSIQAFGRREYGPRREKTSRVMPETAYPATETRQNIEILQVLRYYIHVLSRKQTTKALIRLHRCAGWSVLLLFA